MWLAVVTNAPGVVRNSDLRRVLREEAAIERTVRAGEPFARGAVDVSERVVEIPWVLSRAPRGVGKILDVGTAFAPVVYHRLLSRLAIDEVHLADVAPFRLRAAIAHQADVRELPFEAGTFDACFCISTVEHVGMQNDRYFVSSEADRDTRGDVAALRELARVTKPDGRVLVTVPAGCDEDHGWFRQYSPSTWRDVIKRAGLAIDAADFFTYDAGAGWRSTPPASITKRRYGIGAPYAAALICSSLRPA
jgi:SAM-dependent methyltransferase